MKILCRITRGEACESIHIVHAVVVNERQEIIFSAGNPEFLTCARSSIKPFQASASILLGATEHFGFSEDELALMCASHSGQDIHVKTAKSMANKMGINSRYYECGSHPPYHAATRHRIIRTSEIPTNFHNNCSGKHSGMLALSLFLKAQTKNYTKQNHPAQKEILKQIEKISNFSISILSIDGCSAPTPFLPLSKIATMFQKLGSKKYPELEKLYNAMTNYPFLVGGTDRFDTDYIKAMKGRSITKIGGEAIRGGSMKTEKYGNIGIALKVQDGNKRALDPSLIEILKHLDIISPNEIEQLKIYETPSIYNHRKIEIGKVIPEIVKEKYD